MKYIVNLEIPVIFKMYRTVEADSFEEAKEKALYEIPNLGGTYKTCGLLPKIVEITELYTHYNSFSAGKYDFGVHSWAEAFKHKTLTSSIETWYYIDSEYYEQKWINQIKE